MKPQEDEKEEDLFADLPDNEKQIEAPTSKPSDEEEKKKPTDVNEEESEYEEEEDKEEKKDDKEDKYAEIIKNKDKAMRDERRRRKALEIEMADLKKKYESFDPDEITKKVKEDLKNDSYEQGIISKIKSIPGVTKQTAALIFNTVKSLPANNDPSVSVDLAISYIKEQQRISSSEGTPFIASNEGAFLVEEKRGSSNVPESQRRQAVELTSRLGGQYALNDDALKKYGNLPTL